MQQKCCEAEISAFPHAKQKFFLGFCGCFLALNHTASFQFLVPANQVVHGHCPLLNCDSSTDVTVCCATATGHWPRLTRGPAIGMVSHGPAHLGPRLIIGESDSLWCCRILGIVGRGSMFQFLCPSSLCPSSPFCHHCCHCLHYPHCPPSSVLPAAEGFPGVLALIEFTRLGTCVILQDGSPLGGCQLLQRHCQMQVCSMPLCVVPYL